VVMPRSVSPYWCSGDTRVPGVDPCIACRDEKDDVCSLVATDSWSGWR
jgi:hypothetical protein